MYDKTAGLTDTHAHLSYLAERGIPLTLISDLFDAEFGFILDIGTSPGDLAARIELLCRYPKVRFACGIWPHRELFNRVKESVSQIEDDINAAPQGSVVAIGECGYDRRESPEAPKAERELFELQLELAGRSGLPVIIHSRDAYDETLASVLHFPGVRGVIHCFSYGACEARRFIDAGYFISFAGNVTYKNSSTIREALSVVPKDRILLETDCPYLAPSSSRGKPCHPGLISETYGFCADFLGIEVEELKIAVAENARILFGQKNSDTCPNKSRIAI